MITGKIRRVTIVNLLDKITSKQLRTDLPEFQVGDTVNVGWKVKEGKRERVQEFEGIVIARKGAGLSETFTVRKIASGVGVERIFPVNAPGSKLAYIKVVKKGRVRRAKLYFLRNRASAFKTKERN